MVEQIMKHCPEILINHQIIDSLLLELHLHLIKRKGYHTMYGLFVSLHPIKCPTIHLL